MRNPASRGPDFPVNVPSFQQRLLVSGKGRIPPPRSPGAGSWLEPAGSESVGGRRHCGEPWVETDFLRASLRGFRQSQPDPFCPPSYPELQGPHPRADLSGRCKSGHWGGKVISAGAGSVPLRLAHEPPGTAVHTGDFPYLSVFARGLKPGKKKLAPSGVCRAQFNRLNFST